MPLVKINKLAANIKKVAIEKSPSDPAKNLAFTQPMFLLFHPLYTRGTKAVLPEKYNMNHKILFLQQFQLYSVKIKSFLFPAIFLMSLYFFNGPGVVT